MHASLQPALCYASVPSSTYIQWDKEAGKGLIGAVQCVCPGRVQSAVERSARTVHASTGGRLRAGPSFLAKVDLLIGRWPGWEGGTHLCSRCSSPPLPIISSQLPSQWQLIAISGTMACVRGAATT